MTECREKLEDYIESVGGYVGVLCVAIQPGRVPATVLLRFTDALDWL